MGYDCWRNNIPTQTQYVDAYICWMNEEDLEPKKLFITAHLSVVSMQLQKIHYCMDVDTLGQKETPSLALNQIGRVQLTTSKPIFIDPTKSIKLRVVLL